MHIDSAALSDVGKVREENEDSFFIDDNLRLYVVADGMGGHQAGEVASQLVVETIQKALTSNHQPQRDDYDNSLSPEANKLLQGIREANKEVFQHSRDNETQRGMGSTLATVLFSDFTFIAANVGDSPIYLLRNGEMELLSVFHTVEAEQSAIDPDSVQYLEPRYLHMLTRGMGVAEDVQANICEMQFFNDDCLILCSDGLSNKVSIEEIQTVVEQNNSKEACRILVDMANERGGEDNITILVLKLTMEKSNRNSFIRWLKKVFKVHKAL